MKIGIVISQIDPETVWNAFRFANFSLTNKHEVSVFLIGKGVEYEEIEDTTFNVNEQVGEFMVNNGKMFACGTCLKLRKKEGSQTCPLSSMKDLMDIVEQSDKILTF